MKRQSAAWADDSSRSIRIRTILHTTVAALFLPRLRKMHIHILGICGTFMGGVALLARAAGHTVTGCDANVYPPMSTQLEEQGIRLIEGYGPEQLELKPDVFVVGNAVSRGNPLLEAILDAGLPYVSGPQWLAENVLQGRWVLAVAGTHGKTTTTALLAYLLDLTNRLPNGTPISLAINSLGAGLASTSAYLIQFWPVVILEGTWAVVSVLGLVRWMAARANSRSHRS